MRAAAAALWLSALTAPAATSTLPIHIEDNHAGSFFYLATKLDLGEPHALLLVDAHTDASAAPDSDSLRSGLREVRGEAELGRKLLHWRKTGRVQAFDWIEPLMPLPFSAVWWLSPTREGEGATTPEEVRSQLDGRLPFDSRHCGALGERFLKVDSVAAPEGLPLVVSIDLDYFADVERLQLEAKFAALWSEVLALPRLQAITFSISRPWLANDDLAHELTEIALRAALAVRNSAVTFEPFAPRGPDRSEKAKQFFASGSPPPRYDITTAPASLRSLLLAESERVSVAHEADRWQAQLDAWRAESNAWRVVVDDAQPSTDEVWRLSEPAALRVLSSPRRAIPSKVRWLALRPAQTVYNVLPEVPAGKVFAGVSTPFVSRSCSRARRICVSASS